MVCVLSQQDVCQHRKDVATRFAFDWGDAYERPRIRSLNGNPAKRMGVDEIAVRLWLGRRLS